MTVGLTCDDDYLALEAGQVLVVDLKLGHGIDTTLLWGWRRKVFAYKPSRSTGGMLYLIRRAREREHSRKGSLLRPKLHEAAAIYTAGLRRSRPI